MLLAYVDESAKGDHYLIAALIIPGEEAGSLSTALDEVVQDAADNYKGVTERAELHAYDLFHGTGAWEPLSKLVRARIGLYTKAFEAIADHDVAVILRCMNVRAQRKRYPICYPPHEVVLGHLMEQIDSYAIRQKQSALVIADEVSHEDREQHRRDLRFYQQHGTWGYKAKQIRNIVDTIHFAPSEASRLVQAADLIAFMGRRRATHTETDPRAERASAAIWANIEPKIRHNTCWVP